MTARAKVRTHTRRTASGGVTTVRTHTRGRHGRRRAARRALLSPGHAWKLAGRAWRASRRRRRAAALGLGVLALGELSAWLTLRGVFLILTTAGLLALGAAVVAATATGARI